ncbi:MAG: HipA family kinase [Candidatus Acidiferrales bacterium]
MITQLFAVEHVCKMPGSSQSHLMRCSDRSDYVVKFQNNPQGSRILANELLGSLLAERLGLPVPRVALIYVSEEIIRRNPAMVILLRHGKETCPAGICLGSLYPRGPNPTRFAALRVLRDSLPVGFSWDVVENERDFWGMLVFDKWTCNTDRRQCIFVRTNGYRSYRAMMIDQGYCFNGGEWNFPDSPLQGLYRRGNVYEQVRGIQEFETWLHALETEIDGTTLRKLGEVIPPRWYQFNRDNLDTLLCQLDARRARVRSLLLSTVHACGDFFPRVNRKHRKRKGPLARAQVACSEKPTEFAGQPALRSSSESCGP